MCSRVNAVCLDGHGGELSIFSMPTLHNLLAAAAPLFLLSAVVTSAQVASGPAAASPSAVAQPVAVDVSKPVTPDAMPETVALYDLLRQISGHYTLTGQHNPPSAGGRNSNFATHYTGKVPAVWTSDFGFAGPGDSDSYQSRSIVVAEAIRQHQQGAIISLCWHAVPPTADEPVTFRPLANADPAALHSVQGRLLDNQFKDLLTPGTALHTHWLAQVDAIAGFLKQLQDAHVPIIWRPYHEMNGDWFWWGGRSQGEYTTAALYRQIYDRFVNFHHLKNLLWLWSMDRVSKPGMEHEKFFPGLQYVDVLGLDVYGNDFAQSYYDSLVKLAQGKPLALAEVGNVPPPEVFEKQPLWTYYAVWTAMVRNTSQTEYEIAFSGEHVLTMQSPAFAEITADYRRRCQLPVLHAESHPADFSGNWVLNTDASRLGRGGAAWVAAKMQVTQTGDALTVRSTRIREYTDDEVTTETYKLDGSETKSEFMKAPRVTTAELNSDRTLFSLHSIAYPAMGPNGNKFETRETWMVLDKVDRLAIRTVSDSFGGGEKVTQTLVYDRDHDPVDQSNPTSK